MTDAAAALPSAAAPAGPVGLAGRYVGKTVLVTGGSKGIGEGCVRVFLAAGANVVFCARNEEEVRYVCGEHDHGRG
jgi:NADP-dependent 3-hydroxy acid dehydrogenase YdfG